jgi:hypothetical protein
MPARDFLKSAGCPYGLAPRRVNAISPGVIETGAVLPCDGGLRLT